jgi:hypothetical protein
MFGMGWYTLFLVELAELAPPSAVASTVAFALTLNQIAVVLVPPLLGGSVEAFGNYRPVWLLFSVVLLSTAAYLWRTRGRTAA